MASTASSTVARSRSTTAGLAPRPTRPPTARYRLMQSRSCQSARSSPIQSPRSPAWETIHQPALLFRPPPRPASHANQDNIGKTGSADRVGTSCVRLGSREWAAAAAPVHGRRYWIAPTSGPPSSVLGLSKMAIVTTPACCIPLCKLCVLLLVESATVETATPVRDERRHQHRHQVRASLRYFLRFNLHRDQPKYQQRVL